MRALIQRVKHASVTIDGKVKSSIEKGLLVFVGFADGDTQDLIEPIAKKLSGLRIFEDENEKINLSVSDVDGEILVVSQFTLYADCKKGRRPSFVFAKKPDEANRLYEYFCELCEKELRGVGRGIFGADMEISLVCDGPVTIVMDSNVLLKKTPNNLA